MEQYVVEPEGGRGRAEDVGRCEGEKVKIDKHPPDTREDKGNRGVGGETSDVRGGFEMRNGSRERLATELKGGGYHGKPADRRAYLERGREERGCGYMTSTKGHCGNKNIKSKGVKWLGAEGRVSWGWIRQGAVQCIQMQKVRVQ